MESKDWWNQFLDRSSSAEVEDKRKKFIFYFSSYTGGFIILLFAFQQMSSSNTTLKIVLFSGALITLTNALVSNFFKRIQEFYYVGALGVGFIMIGLVYSGGYMNTALYWVFPFPFVILVILGYRVGFICYAIIYGFIFFMLINQDLIPAEYEPEETSRFLLSLMATVSIMFIGEFFRYQSHLEMTEINVDKYREANTDQLTELPNRRFLDSAFLPEVVAEPDRYFPLSIVALDIDHFKNINDTYGHHVGDSILKHVAGALRSKLRDSDIVARTGGEEFVVLFPKTEMGIGHKLAERLRQGIEENIFDDDVTRVPVTASFGVAVALGENDLNPALKKADEQLYVAKEAGRNQVR